MRNLLLICLVFSNYAHAYDPFDSMRCRGKLMSKGTSIKTVFKLCGAPEYKDHIANQYTSYYKVTYNPNSNGKYVMLFKNGYLIKSKLIVYGADKIKWRNPY